jgi:glyoxylase-like metal-dependent hydrolase (beta-lactamase superfamily II)
VEIQLIELPAGAAPGNLVVYLPAEKILFAGDLAVNACFPYMGDADVAAWVRALDEMERLDCEQVVPGHGAAGDRMVLWQTRKFLADLCAAVKAAKASGRTLAEAGRDFAMPGYAKWPGYRELLGLALERLWEQPLPEISLPPAPAPKAAPAVPIAAGEADQTGPGRGAPAATR